MAGIKCNGLNVFDATIKRGASGCWVADLRVDSDEPITGAVTIETPGQTYKGTALAEFGGVDTNVAHVSVVGGAGGTTKDLEPRGYAHPTLLEILKDLERDTGETLSPTIDPALLTMPIPMWARLRGTLRAELRALLDAVVPGAQWRILEDGTLWIGHHQWKDSAFIHTLVDVAPGDGMKTILVEKPFLAPGVTFEGEKVYEVIDDFSQPSIRQKYATVDPQQSANEKTNRLIDRETGSLRVFGAKTFGSNVDGTVDLRPDDPRMPDMRRVPIKHGLPGVAVKVKPGARCHLMFAEGTRSKPFVAMWDCPASYVETIELAGGTKSVTREGDAVDCGSMSVIMVGGVPKLVYLPPGTPASPDAVAITGKVGPGATKVKA